MIGDFLKQLVEIIKYFRFIRFVRANFQAVRKTSGSIEGPLGPGWYWCLPGVQEIEIETTLRDSVEVHLKSLTTADDVQATFEMVIWFHIHDAYKHWTTINEHKANLAQIAAGHLNQRVRRRKWESIRLRQRRLELSIQSYLTGVTASWGTTIDGVQVTQITRARPVRILGGIPKE